MNKNGGDLSMDLKWESSFAATKQGACGKWNVGLKTRVLIESLCLKPSNPGTWASIYLTPTPLEGDRRLQLWRVWKPSPPKASLPFNFYNTLLLNIDYQDSPNVSPNVRNVPTWMRVVSSNQEKMTPEETEII